MRKEFIKFSDERNRKHSIETILAADSSSDVPLVLKRNVYPEGKEHLENILHYYEILPEAYPNCTICPVKMREDGFLEFEYIKGDTYSDIYRQCMQENDIAKMEETLKNHKAIIESCKQNQCEFQMTTDFASIFGKDGWEEGEPALSITNFDTTAGNIKVSDGKPVFIDYEWVFEFPIPLSFALYYGVRDAYYHIANLEKFYPLEKALQFLGMEKNVDVFEQAIANFYSFVLCEADGTSYGLGKHVHLKGTQHFEELFDQDGHLDVPGTIEFAEKHWKEACQANAVLNTEIQHCRQDLADIQQNMQTTILKETENTRHAMQQETENARQAMQQEVANIRQATQQEIDNLRQDYEAQLSAQRQAYEEQVTHWHGLYETVINTKTWRYSRKLKRLIGKG